MFDITVLTVSPELTQDEFDAFLIHVSPEKRERIKQFRFFRDARNCLLGDVLTRIEICHATGLRNRQLEFTTNTHGKPLLHHNPHTHFNLSHAGDYIACVVADKPVGIDVELIRNADIKIAERFFTPDETAYITQDQQERRFCKVWTKKESRIKWEGKGLHKPLSSFSVIDSNEQESLFYHEVFSNYEVVCHVCSTKQVPPLVRFIDTSMLIRNVRFPYF